MSKLQERIAHLRRTEQDLKSELKRVQLELEERYDQYHRASDRFVKIYKKDWHIRMLNIPHD